MDKMNKIWMRETSLDLPRRGGEGSFFFPGGTGVLTRIPFLICFGSRAERNEAPLPKSGCLKNLPTDVLLLKAVRKLEQNDRFLSSPGVTKKFHLSQWKLQ